MSSETDTFIFFFYLVDVKEGGPSGLGMWGVGFIIVYFFIFLPYSDCTLLTDMPSDIVYP